MSDTANAKRAAARREQNEWVAYEHHHFSHYFGWSDDRIAARIGVDPIHLARVLVSSKGWTA